MRWKILGKCLLGLAVCSLESSCNGKAKVSAESGSADEQRLLAWRKNHPPAEVTAAPTPVPALPPGGSESNTDWFLHSHFGLWNGFSVSPADPSAVYQFDVDVLAKQLADIKAGFVVLNLGQNSGFYVSPNKTYESITGFNRGSHTPTRDLPMDLFRALSPYNVRLMLYLPCQVANSDAFAQAAFGLSQGETDQPLNDAFVQKWAAVIQEWADRYQGAVAGWWFDGCYPSVGFNANYAQIYANAVMHGNSKAFIAFNGGLWTNAEGKGVVKEWMPAPNALMYTAGELNEPFAAHAEQRYLGSSQWHAATYLGPNWGKPGSRYNALQWINWINENNARGGVIGLETAVNYDSRQGPVGAIVPSHLTQLKAISASVQESSAPRIVISNTEGRAIRNLTLSAQFKVNVGDEVYVDEESLGSFDGIKSLSLSGANGSFDGDKYVGNFLQLIEQGSGDKTIYINCTDGRGIRDLKLRVNFSINGEYYSSVVEISVLKGTIHLDLDGMNATSIEGNVYQGSFLRSKF